MLTHRHESRGLLILQRPELDRLGLTNSVVVLWRLLLRWRHVCFCSNFDNEDGVVYAKAREADVCC